MLNAVNEEWNVHTYEPIAIATIELCLRRSVHRLEILSSKFRESLPASVIFSGRVF